EPEAVDRGKAAADLVEEPDTGQAGDGCEQQVGGDPERDGLRVGAEWGFPAGDVVGPGAHVQEMGVVGEHRDQIVDKRVLPSGQHDGEYCDADIVQFAVPAEVTDHR